MEGTNKLFGIGKLTISETPKGKTIYSGYVGRVPVVGFKGVQGNNQNTVYLSVDLRKIDFLMNRQDRQALEEASERDNG